MTSGAPVVTVQLSHRQILVVFSGLMLGMFLAAANVYMRDVQHLSLIHI